MEIDVEARLELISWTTAFGKWLKEQKSLGEHFSLVYLSFHIIVFFFFFNVFGTLPVMSEKWEMWSILLILFSIYYFITSILFYKFK